MFVSISQYVSPGFTCQPEPGLCSTSDWMFYDFCTVIFTTWMFILSQTNSVYFICLLPTNWNELESHLQGFRRISPINPTWSIQDLHIKQIILAKWITIRIKHIWTTLNSPVNHQIIRIPEVFTWIFPDFSHHGFNWIHMAMGQYL